MKKIVIIHLGDGEEVSTVTFLGQEVQIRRIGCHGDAERVRAVIAEHDGQVHAIGLEGYPAELELGGVRVVHEIGATLAATARQTPVVDGGGIRPGLERWAVILADRAEPGIFSQKHVLMAPGLNHGGLAQALDRRTPHLRYGDPDLFFALPDFPGVGSQRALEQAVNPTLEHLKSAPFRRLLPQAGAAGQPRSATPFEWADVIAGDMSAIRRYAPAQLKHKTVAVEWASEEDVQDDLRQRGAAIVVTMMPAMDGAKALGRWSAAAIEAVLVALRTDPDQPLTEDTYLDLMADIHWTPHVRYLQTQEAGINRFAFVIHPLNVRFHPQAAPMFWLDEVPAGPIWWSGWRPTCRPCTSRASPAASLPPPASGSRVISSPWRHPAPDDAARRALHLYRLNQAARMPSAGARASWGWARLPRWWATRASPWRTRPTSPSPAATA
jgi:hypothetical protein